MNTLQNPLAKITLLGQPLDTALNDALTTLQRNDASGPADQPKHADGSTYPRLLILDDVLLSLEMTHRLPLLKLLKNDDFKDWQILLMTYDRAWYEIGKQQLEGWAYHELFTQSVGNHDQPMVREDQDHLMQAIDFLEKGYIKAAAVHVRSKFEEVLKLVCHNFGLAVKYHPNPRKVSTRDYQSAVEGATYDNIPPVNSKTNAKCKVFWWKPKSSKQHVVHMDLHYQIDHALIWVMNPLSHSQSVDRYRPEIEDAIFAVNDLDQAIRKSLAMRQAGPVMLREMLLNIINLRTLSRVNEDEISRRQQPS